ncbi:heterokaryon incompatibility protein-domain-containing protein [Fusarium oxysporum f. sp. albedinis]|nr:heterokaryon incompatibility protein-domain-containing protein [Fusarium oxysporum f. sp. albedinis]
MRKEQDVLYHSYWMLMFTVKRWLAHCAGVHGELCNPGEGKRSLPKGLAVINCTTRKLEPLPTGVKFAALSYVWGDSASTNESYSASSLFLQTIEDAITVALQVGINFLWVDRYCLPQQECLEKREQIQKMHKIYREADLTIIAAAGDGPDYGLPGISTPRVSAPSVDLRLGAHRLVSTGRSAQEAIIDVDFSVPDLELVDYLLGHRLIRLG